ncbi:hypothetical protein ID866_4321 [Astraeus odoratus]|nr:hypothetical protein ID866_4321 [Astraeus odoratus]
MEVVASIPAAISMDDTSVPLSLRLRGKDMTDDERESLRVTGFSVDIEQVEVYRNATNEDHIYRYPILPKQCQPPNQPLRDPHPIHTLYAIGAIVAPPPSKSSTGRIFSLLPKDNGGRYTIGGDNRVFASTGHPASGSECYVLDVNIPITKEPYESDWAGSRMRRLTESSPLFSVRHILRVSVQCVYQDGEGQEPVHQQLHFCLPLRLVHLSAISAECHPAWSSTDAQDKLPYIHTLPAYSQLFHPNGDRKVDYSTPLPLYEPPPSPSSSSFTPSEDHQKTQ